MSNQDAFDRILEQYELGRITRQEFYDVMLALSEDNADDANEDEDEQEGSTLSRYRYYPGDICRHGVYVGGCGADYMCGACEMGED